MKPYMSNTINLLYYPEAGGLVLDRLNQYKSNPYVTFLNDSDRRVKSCLVSYSLSIFNLDYEKTKTDIANFFDTNYSDLMNGPIKGVILYELGAVIFSESTNNIYTHTVLYADVLDAIQNNKNDCKSYRQSYRFSNIKNAVDYYQYYSNRINANLAW